MFYYTVYKTTNKLNGKIYIGVHKTRNLDDGYLGSGSDLIQDIHELGPENFEKEILAFVNTERDMFSLESWLVDDDFIKRADTYNKVKGGSGDGFNYINRNGLSPGFGYINSHPKIKEWRHNWAVKARGSINHPANPQNPSHNSWIRQHSIFFDPVKQSELGKRWWVKYQNRGIAHHCKGRITISDSNGKIKMIKPDELDKNLQDGWVLGNQNLSDLVWVCDGTISKRVKTSQLDTLSEQWKIGRKVVWSSGTKGKVHIHHPKLNLSKFAKQSEIPELLTQGWVKGRSKKHAETTKNRTTGAKWMHDPSTGSNHLVPKTDIEMKLSKGLKLGMSKTKR